MTFSFSTMMSDAGGTAAGSAKSDDAAAVTVAAGTMVTATVVGAADKPSEETNGTSEPEATDDETPEARQRGWMLRFIENERALQHTDYMNKFMRIRMEQEVIRADAAFGCAVSASANQFIRNRYRDILPYDANRVQLRVAAPGENPDGYVNASHIELPHGKTTFIAAQAPLPSTLDDFWQMIDEQGVRVIVMLCKLVEMAKVKCERYWPELEGGCDLYGDYNVLLVKEEKFADDEYVLRTLRLQKEGEDWSRTIHQLHYREWPDHGCPTGSKQLLNMIEKMSELAAATAPSSSAPSVAESASSLGATTNSTATRTKPPVLVHCSAGVGRTGTIIAINHVRELIQQNLCNDLDVYQLVMALRRQRSSMVQTQDQYQFVHRCVAAYCRQELNLPDEISEEPAHPPPKLPIMNGYLPTPPLLPTLDSDEDDDGDEPMDASATVVPNYPDEPRAPRGPEDMSGLI